MGVTKITHDYILYYRRCVYKALSHPCFLFCHSTLCFAVDDFVTLQYNAPFKKRQTFSNPIYSLLNSQEGDL